MGGRWTTHRVPLRSPSAPAMFDDCEIVIGGFGLADEEHLGDVRIQRCGRSRSVHHERGHEHSQCEAVGLAAVGALSEPFRPPVLPNELEQCEVGGSDDDRPLASVEDDRGVTGVGSKEQGGELVERLLAGVRVVERSFAIP
jgi:hypothetical protein